MIEDGMIDYGCDDVKGYGVSCFPGMGQGINLLLEFAEQSHGCTLYDLQTP